MKESAFYYKAMLWAVENNITSGMTKTTFVPNGNCNRCQVVTFLYRTLKDGIPEEKPTEPTDFTLYNFWHYRCVITDAAGTEVISDIVELPETTGTIEWE